MTFVGRAFLAGLIGFAGQFCLPLVLFAVEIVSPKNGAELPIGSEVIIQVQPTPGDDIVRVYLAGSEEPMKYNDQTGYFEQRVKLRGDALGSIPLEVVSINSQGAVSTSEIQVNVKLPPVLPLISLRIHAEQRKLVLEGLGERQNLQVIGEFPDGTVRIISATVYGTTYLSRDSHVATVDVNGWVTAVGLGETTIVVRNGDKETQARIVVRIKAPGEEKDT
jgi:Big-like domain-containing protein